MKKKNFLFGIVLLTASAVLAKVLGAVYRIPLTNLLKAEGMGIYQLIFPVFALFLALTTSGFPIAISRIVSEETALNNDLSAKRFFKSSLILMLVLGFIFSAILIICSSFIAKSQGAENAFLCYFAISPAIIFASLLSAFKGYFQGLEKMEVSAFSGVIEQLFKLVFGLLFANFFMQYGTVFAVMGACLGIALSEVIAFVYALIYYLIYKNKHKTAGQQNEIVSYKVCFKKLIKEGLPITFANLVLPILAVIDSFLIVNLIVLSGFESGIALSLYGISDGIIASLISLPTVVTLSIATAIVPHLSGLSSLKKKEDIVKKSGFAVKMVWILALPCAVAMFLFSDSIISFLYQSGLNTAGLNESLIASNLLKLSAISIIYVSFMHIFTSILQALKKSYVPLKNLIIASIIKIILTIVLVNNPSFNIYGMVVADVVCYATACILNLKAIKKCLSTNFSFINFMFKPVCAVIASSSFAILFNNIIENVMFGRFKTILILGVFAITYLFFIYFLKVFDNTEISFKFFRKKKTKNV